jgi:hypothetical protein
MKNFQKKFMRLLVMYEHLMAGQLYIGYNWYPEELDKEELAMMLGFDSKLPSFLLNEMTCLFSEWVMTKFGTTYYKPHPALGTEAAMMEFFAMSKKELYHCFLAGEQSVSDYGGEELLPDATPQQIALNIHHFLEKILEQEQTNNFSKEK